MYKYVMTFSKTGVICYTSHLDLMRFFNRAFKKAGIKLEYSKGFNPHPRMGFAQPLSLGYEGLNELIEFETVEDNDPDEIAGILSDIMPDGLTIKNCSRWDGKKKTLAARTEAAKYHIRIPVGSDFCIDDSDITESYMRQDKITALKKKKKHSELQEIDIKPMIRQLQMVNKDNAVEITAVLDSGSISNLSPELLIDTVKDHFGIDTDRCDIDVRRERIYYT